MKDTVVRQYRQQLPLSDGSLRYEITAVVEDQGDFPFPHLFVLAINDAAAPQADVFARVSTPADIRQADETAPVYVRVSESDLVRVGSDLFARIANVNDLTQLPRDRAVAVQQGKKEYLSTAFSVSYDNVTSAEAAWRQINARVSTLINEWRTAQGSFYTSPFVDYDLPQVGQSEEDLRKAVYTSAKAARVAAEASRDAAKSAKDQCELGCAAGKTIYDFLVDDVAFLLTAKTVVTSITETGTTNAKDFALKQASYSTDARSYEALLTQKQTDLAVYASRVRECDANCTRLGAALLAAQQQVDAARTAENTALAAVLAVCPTFTP